MKWWNDVNGWCLSFAFEIHSTPMFTSYKCWNECGFTKILNSQQMYFHRMFHVRFQGKKRKIYKKNKYYSGSTIIMFVFRKLFLLFHQPILLKVLTFSNAIINGSACLFHSTFFFFFFALNYIGRLIWFGFDRKWKKTYFRPIESENCWKNYIHNEVFFLVHTSLSKDCFIQCGCGKESEYQSSK